VPIVRTATLDTIPTIAISSPAARGFQEKPSVKSDSILVPSCVEDTFSEAVIIPKGIIPQRFNTPVGVVPKDRVAAVTSYAPTSVPFRLIIPTIFPTTALAGSVCAVVVSAVLLS